MKSSKPIHIAAAFLASTLALPLASFASAGEIDSSIAACLKAWGDHPFGATPQFKTVGTSFKLFGIGGEIGDTQPTNAPSLVLINPSFNLMGGSSIELLNPNGWYCLRTTVSVMGRVSIRAHCKAQLAATSAGSTVLGNNSENRNIRDLAVTVMSTVGVERPCN